VVYTNHASFSYRFQDVTTLLMQSENTGVNVENSSPPITVFRWSLHPRRVSWDILDLKRLQKLKVTPRSLRVMHLI